MAGPKGTKIFLVPPDLDTTLKCGLLLLGGFDSLFKNH